MYLTFPNFRYSYKPKNANKITNFKSDLILVYDAPDKEAMGQESFEEVVNEWNNIVLFQESETESNAIKMLEQSLCLNLASLEDFEDYDYTSFITKLEDLFKEHFQNEFPAFQIIQVILN